MKKAKSATAVAIAALLLSSAASAQLPVIGDLVSTGVDAFSSTGLIGEATGFVFELTPLAQPVLAPLLDLGEPDLDQLLIAAEPFGPLPGLDLGDLVVLSTGFASFLP